MANLSHRRGTPEKGKPAERPRSPEQGSIANLQAESWEGYKHREVEVAELENWAWGRSCGFERSEPGEGPQGARQGAAQVTLRSTRSAHHPKSRRRGKREVLLQPELYPVPAYGVEPVRRSELTQRK